MKVNSCNHVKSDSFKSGLDRAADCRKCESLCCRYVATQIDAPTCKRDYDYIRWYLLHRKTNVFVDDEGDWYIEFETPCEELGADGLCRYYEKRPRICRRHGDAANECEFGALVPPHKLHFKAVAEFESYLARKGIDWRWKR